MIVYDSPDIRASPLELGDIGVDRSIAILIGQDLPCPGVGDPTDLIYIKLSLVVQNILSPVVPVVDPDGPRGMPWNGLWRGRSATVSDLPPQQ